MKITKEFFFFCRLGKKSANIGKIRRYCSKGCPHLGKRLRKKVR